MRVAELADLTGVTVRTVRHYHSLGLLPVPPVRAGVRDYDLEHVARVSRIRWLAEAGVPLATVAEVLDAERPTGSTDGSDRRAGVLRDLRATLVALEVQLERLTAQRSRLARLVESVENAGPLSAMPQVAVDFYARLEHHATDEGARRQVVRERDFVELAYYRGVIPSELELLFSALDDQALQDSLSAFGRDPDAALTDQEVDALADAIVERMSSRLGPDLALIAERVGVDGVRRAYELYVGSVSGTERRVGEAVGRRLELVVRSLEERV